MLGITKDDLMEEVRSIIQAYDEEKEKEKNEINEEPDEDGWVTVTSK